MYLADLIVAPILGYERYVTERLRQSRGVNTPYSRAVGEV